MSTASYIDGRSREVLHIAGNESTKVLYDALNAMLACMWVIAMRLSMRFGISKVKNKIFNKYFQQSKKMMTTTIDDKNQLMKLGQ